MKLFLLTRSSGNYGTFTFAVIADSQAEAEQIALEKYPPRWKGSDCFYQADSCEVSRGAVIWHENNE